ncbi:MAG: hypothetical protein ACKVTZ_10475 [Bacteroidia bacterium]
MHKYFFVPLFLLSAIFYSLDIQAQDTIEKSSDNEKSSIKVRSKRRSNNEDKKYAIKIDPGYLLIRQPYFYYEDVVSERSSLQWEASFQVPWQLKPDFYAQIINAQDTSFRSKPATLTGFSLGLAYKYYMTHKRRSPIKGAYIAPYFRYLNYSLTFPDVITSGPNATTMDWKVNATLEGWRLGMMVGWQWASANGFTVDWTLGGASYGAYIVTMRATTEDELEFQQLKDLSEKFVQEIERRTTNIKVTLDENRAQGKVRGEFWTIMPRIQTGITVGYSFN